VTARGLPSRKGHARRLTLGLFAVALALECAPARRMAPRPLMPDPPNMVPLRARTVYRDMGLMVDTSRLPFVASVRFFAGATPDSTLLVFAMSLANRALNFRRDSDALVADYHVELTLRKDSSVVRHVMQDEKVRVSTIPETMRRDESIIFQQVLSAHPGIYSLNVVVRDRTTPAYAQVQLLDTVPQLDAPGLGGPIPIYESAGRARRGAPPQLVANPRGTTSYEEWVRFYVEGYGLARGTRLAARLVDLDTVELWRDTLALAEGPLASVQFAIKPGVLPLGRAEFQVQAVNHALEGIPEGRVRFHICWGSWHGPHSTDVPLKDVADLLMKVQAQA